MLSKPVCDRTAGFESFPLRMPAAFCITESGVCRIIKSRFCPIIKSPVWCYNLAQFVGIIIVYSLVL